ETPEAAALRELREETGLQGGQARRLAVVRHDYGDRCVELHACLVSGTRGEPRPLASQGVAWKHLSDLTGGAMPAANQALLTALEQWLAASAAAEKAPGTTPRSSPQ
nr:NUDIX domain-containing protein [Gemmatimonadota bacterium]